ncbi:hypothetical protein L7F22_028147 [Adiantum nelumboides]|nr:hypothetical protein [Adiantum nelumboides]
MAAMVRFIASRRGRLASPSCLLQGSRHSHRQSMWEQILGRKIAPSTIKAIEDAYTEFEVSKSVPSWLPFHPNSSFWIPSYEVSLTALEELADVFERFPPASHKRKSEPSFTASPDLADDGITSSKALSTIQVVDQLVNKLQDIPLEDGTFL